MPLVAWICCLVTLMSALVSLGFAVHATATARGEARTPSRYALSRSLALVVLAVMALASGATVLIAGAAVAMIVVQAADAVIGVLIHDRLRTFGPALTAAANAAALAALLLG